MQKEIDKIEVNCPTESWSEIMKQFVQIPVRGDGFRNLKEGSVLIAENLCLATRRFPIIHGGKNIPQFKVTQASRV